MFRYQFLAAALTTAIGISATSASAAIEVLRFENQAGPNDNVILSESLPYIEGTFSFSNPTRFSWGIYGSAVTVSFDGYSIPSNGTAALAFCSSNSCRPTVTMSRANPFTVVKLDVAKFHLTEPDGALVISGHFIGGGTISQTVALTSNWTTRSL